MRGVRGSVPHRWWVQARRIRQRIVMITDARARRKSTVALRLSVQRRSLPKLFIQEFGRSTTHRPPVRIGTFASSGAMCVDVHVGQSVVDYVVVVTASRLRPGCSGSGPRASSRLA